MRNGRAAAKCSIFHISTPYSIGTLYKAYELRVHSYTPRSGANTVRRFSVSGGARRARTSTSSFASRADMPGAHNKLSRSSQLHSTSHHTETYGLRFTLFTVTHRIRETHSRVVASRRKTASQRRQTDASLEVHAGPFTLAYHCCNRRLTSWSRTRTAFSVARVTLTCRDLRLLSTIQLCQYRPGPPSSPTAAWGQLLVNRE